MFVLLRMWFMHWRITVLKLIRIASGISSSTMLMNTVYAMIRTVPRWIFIFQPHWKTRFKFAFPSLLDCTTYWRTNLFNWFASIFGRSTNVSHSKKSNFTGTKSFITATTINTIKNQIKNNNNKKPSFSRFDTQLDVVQFKNVTGWCSLQRFYGIGRKS